MLGVAGFTRSLKGFVWASPRMTLRPDARMRFCPDEPTVKADAHVNVSKAKTKGLGITGDCSLRRRKTHECTRRCKSNRGDQIRPLYVKSYVKLV